MSFADEQIYPTYKVALLCEVLGEQGIPQSAVLAGTGLDLTGVSDAQTRISRRQLVAAYRNAVRLSPDPACALVAGNRIRVTSYGMFGFALMASANLQDALSFAIQYHDIATPTVRLSLGVDDDDAKAVYTIDDLLDEPELRTFNLELQFSLILSLVHDLVGDDFALTEIRASYPEPPHAGRYAERFRCPVTFGAPRDEMRFDESWLARPLLRSNPISAQVTKAMCDRLLAEMALPKGIAGRVHEVVSADLRGHCDVESVAKKLGLSARTLRRRLAEQGTTFQQLLREIRMQFAIAYLRDTDIKVDDIADRLGFSDAANFRHAFRRWTEKSPSEYRTVRSGL